MMEAGSGKSVTIGLVLDFFNAEILEGARAYVDEQDGLSLDARWSVRGDWTPKDPEWEGLIYSVVDNEKLRKRLERWKIKKVSLVDDHSEWSVIPDYAQCGVIAVEELIDSGALQILNLSVGLSAIDKCYKKGVRAACEKHQIKCVELDVFSSSLREVNKKTYQKINELKGHLGIATPHSGVLFGLQKYLLRLGVSIPEDVSMVAIEKDVQQTHNLAPVPLTAVQIDDWLRGFVAAEVAHRLLENDVPKQKKVVIPPRGIKQRASTGHLEIPDRLVASSLIFLRKNFLKPIDVSDIVNHVNASRRTVETRFRETLNRGIHEELSRMRINEAKRLIQKKDRTVTSIAESCGFSSVHYFSAAFKRITGMSPKAYQKQL